MARKALGIGELGKITTSKIRHNQYEARARVGTLDGSTKQIKARGSKAADARDRLQAAARKVAYSSDTAPITAKTTLGELVTMTIDDMALHKKVKPQSIREYRSVEKMLRGERGDRNISNVELGDCEPLIIDWIEEVGERAPSSGKRARQILVQSFDFAKRRKLSLWASNPADGAEVHTAGESAAVELSDLELEGIRQAVKAWQTPRRSLPLKYFIETLIGTGARVNEVLALRWSDLNLHSEPATATISGTLVFDEDNKLIRQDETKTPKGYRIIVLPTWLKASLLELRGISTDLRVFPSRNGTWINSTNMRRAFREALDGTPYKGWQLKGFRSALATRLERSIGVSAAADQLGHGDPAITSRHYIVPASVVGDYSLELDKLAPKQSAP